VLAVFVYLAYTFAFPSSSLTYDEVAYQPLPYVMYGLKPDFTRGGTLVRSSNAQGFRGAAIEMPKPAGRYRIVCLGGSTTYSFAVNDDQTYPLHLQSALVAARPDLDVEVINAGVESYTTAESLNNLVFRVLELEPDAIVVYHGANDVRVRRYANYAPGYEHYRRSWSGSVDRLGTTSLGGINELIQHERPEPPGDAGANLRATDTASYRRNITSMVAVAAAHGVLPVLVTFALGERFAQSERQPELIVGVEQHNDVTREVAAEHGAVLIDLAQQFGPHAHLFVDSVHLNDEGCEVKADLIAADLVAHLP
jgi:lysophospholipase L1-like esterase